VALGSQPAHFAGGYYCVIKSAYSINPTTGALTFVGAAPTPPGPHGVAVDSFGQFVYVTDNTASLVSGSRLCFRVVDSLPCRALRSQRVRCPPASRWIPSGSSYTLRTTVANTVTLYLINPATGGLTFSAVSGTGAGPAGVSVDHFGQFLYAANNGAATVSAYSISPATGALAGLPTVATGTGPTATVVDQSERFLYVTDSVSGYQINQLSGHLAASPGSPFAAGLNPVAVATTP
jgi:6-phosphogluconolactonase (cycloisomerase 2 family)